MGLNGARIVVVGGGSGIGHAVARAALAEGAEVVIASTGAERLAAAAERLGGVAWQVLDITDEAAVAAFFAAAGRSPRWTWAMPRRCSACASGARRC
jgi:NAD(P)-dependent dehydrogenase (short-subunit alcohol dehydrogenase family)